MNILVMIVVYAVKIIKIIIGIRVVISWFAPYTKNEFTDMVYKITEPILAPFRIFSIPMGQATIDLAPVIAYFTIDFLGNLILKLIFLF